MNITVMEDDNNITSVSFSSMSNNPKPYRYGAQPPQFNGSSNVAIMQDIDEPNRGPAYFIQQPFDKLVILKETDFSVMNSKRWFNAEHEYAELNERDDEEYAQASQKPWFCFWNGTLLEVFIFVSQDSVDSSTSTTPGFPQGVPATPTAAFGLSIPSVPTPRHWPRRDMPSLYPKVVKLEERRNSANEITPYCQQMQIMDDGTASLVGEKQELNETEPSATGIRRRGWLGRLSLNKRDTGLKGCQCNWVSA